MQTCHRAETTGARIMEDFNMNYHLGRFTEAQEKDYARALREIKNGRKETHWMWYIFPQIRGLGRSSTANYYSIADIDEAKAFLQDSYLGGNLQEICEALLRLKENNASRIFGYPDDLKLHSSMTLFSCASEGSIVFDQVLEKFFAGEKNQMTLAILSSKK